MSLFNMLARIASCYFLLFCMSVECVLAVLVRRNHRGSRGQGLDPVKHVSSTSNLLLTVPMRYLCCGSSMLHVVVFVCVYVLQCYGQLPILLSVLFCFVI